MKLSRLLWGIISRCGGWEPRFLLEREKQTLISPTNTGVDEGKGSFCFFFYLRTQFPNTLIAPKNLDYHQYNTAKQLIALLLMYYLLNELCFVYCSLALYYSLLLLLIWILTFLPRSPMRINKVFILSYLKFIFFSKFPLVILFWITAESPLFINFLLKTTTRTKALHRKSLFSVYFMSSVPFMLHDQSVVAAELSVHSGSDYYAPHSWLLVISGIGFLRLLYCRCGWEL